MPAKETPYLGRYVKLAVLLQKLSLESKKLMNDNLQRHKPFTEILIGIPEIIGKDNDKFLSKIISKIEKNKKTFMHSFDMYMLQIAKNYTLVTDTLLSLVKNKRCVVERYYYFMGLTYQRSVQINSYLKENRESQKLRNDFEKKLNTFSALLKEDFIFIRNKS